MCVQGDSGQLKAFMRLCGCSKGAAGGSVLNREVQDDSSRSGEHQ